MSEVDAPSSAHSRVATRAHSSSNQQFAVRLATVISVKFLFLRLVSKRFLQLLQLRMDERESLRVSPSGEFSGQDSWGRPEVEASDGDETASVIRFLCLMSPCLFLVRVFAGANIASFNR